MSGENVLGFTPIAALTGGAMIGLAAVLLLKINGRIAGISGILNGAISSVSGDRLWRWLFVLGLVASGFGYQQITGTVLITREGLPWSQLIIAGVLVGFGTKLGSGCTSGHGVCGIARLSPRSLAATTIFLTIGAITATLLFRVLGAQS